MDRLFKLKSFSFCLFKRFRYQPMTTLNEYDLIQAATSLFSADAEKLASIICDYLKIKDSKWGRVDALAWELSTVTYNNGIDSLIEILENETKNKYGFDWLDYTDIKLKLCFLIGLGASAEIQGNGVTPLHFVTKTGRITVAWAAILLVYLHDNGKKLTFEEFSNEFVRLMENLQKEEQQTLHNMKRFEAEDTRSPQSSQRPPSQRPIQSAHQQYITLILVFGQSKWEQVKNIEHKAAPTDDIGQLVYEWFWYGPTSKIPADIPLDEQGNMCWLRLDCELSPATALPTVKNRLGVKDLMKAVEKQQIKLVRKKALGLFQLQTSGLSKNGFIR